MNIIQTEHKKVLSENKTSFVTFPGKILKTPIEAQYVFEDENVLLFSLNPDLHCTHNIVRMSVVANPHTPESFILLAFGERFLVQTTREIAQAKRKFHDKYKTVFPRERLYCVRLQINRIEVSNNQ